MKLLIPGGAVYIGSHMVRYAQEYVTNTKIPYQIEGRRQGDPAVLVAENKFAVDSLNWNPQFSDINDIIKSAWSWHDSEEC